MHRKACIWGLAAFWIAMSFGFCFSPLDYPLNPIYIGGFSVAIGLYGLDRFWTAMNTQEERIKWAGFLVSFGLSLAGDIITATNGLLLSTVPFVYIIVHRLWINDQIFITIYLPDWMNWRKPAEFP
jgi:hypothetical protein